MILLCLIFRMISQLNNYVIRVMATDIALQQIKVNKSVGPDNVAAWVLRDNASTLATPLTALFNTSLRDGMIPALWKQHMLSYFQKTTSTVDRKRYSSNFAYPNCFTKIFELIVMKWVDHILENKIDDKQFVGGVGKSTTDALVEMIHHWCEAT